MEANVRRYRELWEKHQGVGVLTFQGTEPKIGLVNHIVLAETDEEAMAIANPAWEDYKWNLSAPRRLEAEKRGLTQFLVPNERMRPLAASAREARRDLYWSLEERSPEEERRRSTPGGLGGEGQGAGFGVIAGSPASIREYMDECLKTGANYFVCSLQWGSLNHGQAMRSLELFVEEVMPYYVEGVGKVPPLPNGEKPASPTPSAAKGADFVYYIREAVVNWGVSAGIRLWPQAFKITYRRFSYGISG